jgi:chemotaxis protein CheX
METISQELMVTSMVTATVEVFEMMLGAPATPGEPQVDAGMTGPSDSVIALAGIAGSWIGTGSISCSVPLACRLSSALLSAEFTNVDDEVLDAFGEIANMIIGNVKNHLEKVAGPLGLSIPTVVFGKNFVTRSASKRSWVTVPFDTAGERFNVHLCIEPSNSRARLAHAIQTRLQATAGGVNPPAVPVQHSA